MKLLFAIVLSLFFVTPALARPACLNATVEIKKTKTQKATTKPLKLEIAATPETREYGLMNRKSITPCDGMAFFFPATSLAPLTFSNQKFWMKNTLIPLDILFLDASGTIVHITTAQPLSLKAVGPNGPVATVIEIAGGRAKKEGITIGDKVRYELQTTPWQLAH